jgi:hypothetical protein
MTMFLKSQIRFSEVSSEGKRVSVSRSQLVEAVNWTDAETTLYKQYEGLDFTIKRIDPFTVHDIFQSEEVQEFYLCKVVFVSENSKGKEKKYKQNMLVSAGSVPEAHERIHEELKSMLIPYEVKDVNKSPIAELFLQPVTV